MQLQNFQGPFAQIKTHEDHREFELMDIWTIVVLARQAQPTVNQLRKAFPEDRSLVHIRRINKDHQTENGVMFMRVAVCAVTGDNTRQHVQNLLQKVEIDDSTLELRQCCKHQGLSKQQTREWADKAQWPMVWRGNVDMIPTPLTSNERDTATAHLRNLAVDKESKLACMIVDPETNQVVVHKVDDRENGGPLNHCVMDAIHQVANQEHERRSTIPADQRTYLCLNMHVYLTHEPCVMCAMALNHSRIAKLFYIKESPSTGGIEPTSGGGHCVHWNANLNWTYEAWKYVESDLELPEFIHNGCGGHV